MGTKGPCASLGPTNASLAAASSSSELNGPGIQHGLFQGIKEVNFVLYADAQKPVIILDFSVQLRSERDYFWEAGDVQL